MARQLDEATKILVDSLPENLQKLAYSSFDLGYFSHSDFLESAESDEVPEAEYEEVLNFFQQDLSLEIIESNSYKWDNFEYDDLDDKDKTRGKIDSGEDQVDALDDDYECYSKQLERTNNSNFVRMQYSGYSYPRQINATGQLLVAEGEVAIAKRIEVATRLMLYALCESPMTIKAMIGWYEELLNDNIRLRNVVNLDAMYIAESDQKSGSKSKKEEDFDEEEVDNLDDLDDEDKKEEKGTGIAINVMEEFISPIVMDEMAKVKRIFSSMEKLYIKRLSLLEQGCDLDPKDEDKYDKLRIDIYEHISKIRLHDDRIEEILSSLISSDNTLMGWEGKLFRLATSFKIKREDFLETYLGNELNKNWVKCLEKSKNSNLVKFVQKNKDMILKIQDELLKISNKTGQPPAEYKKVVELVRFGKDEVTKAKKEMIEANLALVRTFAEKHVSRGLGLDLSDLIQEGNIGLMKAVDKFNYRLGNKFSTYATNWINQAITRSVADHARTIRIPVHMIDNIHKIQRASRQFMHKHGRNPTTEELSKIIYLPVSKIHEALKVNVRPVSLEQPIEQDGDSSRIEFIADENVKNPFHSAVQKNLKKVITQVLSELDPKEETVLRKRFGMSSNETYTLEEVGDEIEVTRERIRQIQQKALMKLRHPTRAKRLKPFFEG